MLNTAAEVRLNATFAPQTAPGRVGLLSQSGGVGIAIIEAASRLGLGLSSFVSVGNKTDLSSNDLLQYWEQDPHTDVALLYLESFGNPRKLARVARRFARKKPILAVKSGRSAAGARATSSHTGALLSASDVTVDALFRQAGVIRTDTLHDLFDVAALVAKQPIPRGDRIAIVTNGGGPGIITADACQAYGVRVPELGPEVRAQLKAALPNAASLGNPIDLVASATAQDYGNALRILVDSGACDAIVTIFVPPLVTQALDVALVVREVAQSAKGCTMDEASAIISEELAGGATWLAPARVSALLSCYGLPLIATREVSDVSGAVAAAAEMGVPIALKAVASGLLHKSDAGGVALDLEGAGEVREAATEIAELDCNPLIAGATGATIVDARVCVAASQPPPPLFSLRA